MAYYFKKNYRPNSSSKKTSYNNLLNDLFLHFTDKDTDFFNESHRIFCYDVKKFQKNITRSYSIVYFISRYNQA